MTTGQVIAIAVMIGAMLASGAFIAWDWWKWNKEQKEEEQKNRRHHARRK